MPVLGAVFIILVFLDIPQHIFRALVQSFGRLSESVHEHGWSEGFSRWIEDEDQRA